MARITVEDCLENEKNRFSLVRLASRRAKQLLAGQPTVSDTKGNKAVVSALREIADGKVKFTEGSPLAKGEDLEGSSLGDTPSDSTPINGSLEDNGVVLDSEDGGNSQTTIVQSH